MGGVCLSTTVDYCYLCGSQLLKAMLHHHTKNQNKYSLTVQLLIIIKRKIKVEQDIFFQYLVYSCQKIYFGSHMCNKIEKNSLTIFSIKEKYYSFKPLS